MASTPKHHSICISLLILSVWLSQAVSSLSHEASMKQRHDKWVARYKRTYKDASEKEMRYKIFKANVEYVDEFNSAGDRPYKLGVNALADQTNEEFRASLGRFRSPMKKPLVATSHGYKNVTAVPSSVDWRKKGAVTPIRNETCGKQAYQILCLCLRSKMASRTRCQCKRLWTATKPETMLVVGVSHMQHSSSLTRMVLPVKLFILPRLTVAPVAVTIDGGGAEFQFYSAGIFTGKCETSLNLGVTVVGYGTSDDGIKFWIVKNSWGTGWGEEGYIRMQRDIGAKEGLCGIAMEASYPTA